MLNRTSELAIRTMLFLALEGNDKPMSPKVIAESLECSPTYLSKTTGLLVRAGLLRSLRGTNGGVLLSRGPGRITLLEIISACQGLMIPNFCESDLASHYTCAFHRAMLELYQRTVETLSHWTLARILERPVSPQTLSDGHQCRMRFKGCDDLVEPASSRGTNFEATQKGGEP